MMFFKEEYIFQELSILPLRIVIIFGFLVFCIDIAISFNTAIY
jgi:hypothetical protein